MDNVKPLGYQVLSSPVLAIIITAVFIIGVVMVLLMVSPSQRHTLPPSQRHTLPPFQRHSLLNSLSMTILIQVIGSASVGGSAPAIAAVVPTAAAAIATATAIAITSN